METLFGTSGAFLALLHWQRCSLHRLRSGKVLGGSSALHANAWQRSAKKEYDAWGNVFGNGDGWTWDGLLPYFARSEQWTAPPSGEDALVPSGSTAHHASIASVHGKNGPINISYNTHLSDLDRPLTEAMVNLGFPLNDNPDDGYINYLPRDGIPRSVNPREGKRSYAASAYYTTEVQSRKNLSVITGAVVNRLVWDKSNGKPRATGVEFTSGSKKYVVNVRKEVILSAGELFFYSVLASTDDDVSRFSQVTADFRAFWRWQQSST